MVHGRHVALFDHTVLLGEVCFGESLTEIVSSSRTQSVMIVAYSLVGSIANLLSHKLVHPLVGLFIIATVVGEAGDNERHVEGLILAGLNGVIRSEEECRDAVDVQEVENASSGVIVAAAGGHTRTRHCVIGGCGGHRC